MKFKALLLSATLIVISLPAQAADLPLKAPKYIAPYEYVAPTIGWTGFYVGGHSGHGTGQSKQRDTPTAAIFPPMDGDYDVNGFFLGGTIGYNWQLAQWLLGLEADYAWSDVSGSSPVCGGVAECGTELNSFGTVRGRVGWIVRNTLLYGTGGMAIGDISAYDMTAATANGQKTQSDGRPAAAWSNN